MYSRCRGLKTTLSFSAVSLTLLNNGFSAGLKSEKPNILLIMADDMGYGDMGCAGHPYVKTPNIDRLAHEGTLFTDFYVNSGVCAPSRVAFLTGQFPARQNVHAIYSSARLNRENGIPDFLNPDVLTVADVLSGEGYATMHIGKWHICGAAGGPTPDAYGFGSWLVSNPSVIASPVYRERMKNSEHTVSDSSRWMVDDAMDFMSRNRESGKPFFINLCFLAPHSPLKPTEEELAVYEGLKTDPTDFSSWMKEYVAGAKNLTSQMKIYCATMTGMDREIGRLLDYLDKNGLSENTLVVFTSDNGPEDYHIGNSSNAGVGSPGEYRARKRSAYLGGMRVPCIVRWPGKTPAGIKNSSVWSGVDFLPTMAAVAGARIPDHFEMDGESLLPILSGALKSREKPLFWEWKFEVAGKEEYTPPQLAMLDGKWWAGCNPDGSRMELYDISSDPQQRHNLLREQPEVAARMADQLIEWKAGIPERYIPPKEPLPIQPAGFTYSADIAATGRHRDTVPPSRLCNGKYAVAGKDSVQFSGSVELTIDLGHEQSVQGVVLHAFQRLNDFVVSDFDLMSSVDGEQWVLSETIVNHQAEQDGEQVSMESTFTGTVRYLRLKVRKAPSAKRILLGEIEIKR